jgi:hypothetical protein
MGTRSLTVFKEDGKEIVVMYRQFDGYPSGHGKDLAEILAGRKIVNGFSSIDKKVFNGMGCLAAQVVAELKDGPGNIYLYPAGTRDCWEEYVYIVTGKVGQEPHIEIEGIFEGSASEVLAYCNKEK